MSSFLIILHVLAAVLLIGPVCVATSAFPGQLLNAAKGDQAGSGATRVLHNITNTYGYISAIVPVLGIAVFLTNPDFMPEIRFHIAILLAVIAWCLLFFLIIPKQKKAVAALEGAGAVDVEGTKKQLAAFSGIFNLLWMICAILMFI
ncbi:TPA: DUF2269 domain-containing protein [Corynebacterium striatum]|nr:DUF2269 domain-containing protein [Corynebacterium striatum]